MGDWDEAKRFMGGEGRGGDDSGRRGGDDSKRRGGDDSGRRGGEREISVSC